MGTWLCFLGNLGARTNGEDQSPMHYAAKNNATASLKTMLRLGAFINERDYKQRTPLFVAAETGTFWKFDDFNDSSWGVLSITFNNSSCYL